MLQLTSPKFQAFDNNGLFLIGGKLYTYESLTDTPAATYTTILLTPGTENTNPIILDARGEATIYGDRSYKFVLKDANNVTIWTLDPVSPYTSESDYTTSPEDNGAVGDGIVDDSAALEYTIRNAGDKIVLLTKKYNVVTTINATNLPYVRIVGTSAAMQFNHAAQLVGNTGSNPVIDFAGSKWSLEGVDIHKGTDAPSTIGILCGFSTTADDNYDSAHSRIKDVSILLGHDQTANDGLGLVGIMNRSCEDMTYDHIVVYANLPVVLTSLTDTSWIPGSSYTIVSNYTTFTANSCGGHTFVGDCMLIPTNGYRPGIAIRDAQDVDLGNTYIGYVNYGGSVGTYKVGMLLHGVWNLQYRGAMENLDQLAVIPGQASNLDIQVRFHSSTHALPLIDVTDTVSGIVSNARFKVTLKGTDHTPRRIFDATVTPGTLWGGNLWNVKVDITGGLTDTDWVWGHIDDIGLPSYLAIKAANVTISVPNGKIEYVGFPAQSYALGFLYGGIQRFDLLKYMGSINATPQTSDAPIVDIILPADNTAGAVFVRMIGRLQITQGPSGTDNYSIPFEFETSMVRDGTGATNRTDNITFTTFVNAYGTLGTLAVGSLSAFWTVTDTINIGHTTTNGVTSHIFVGGTVEMQWQGFGSDAPLLLPS